jgi:hypothetical protein
MTIHELITCRQKSINNKHRTDRDSIMYLYRNHRVKDFDTIKIYNKRYVIWEDD